MKYTKLFGHILKYLPKKKVKRKRSWHLPETSQSFKKRRKNIHVSLSSVSKIVSFTQSRYFFISTALLLGGIGLFISFGPLFQVKHINIIKRDSISNIEISYSSLNSIRGDHIFQLSFDDITKKMLSYQPNLKSIESSLQLPDTLKINIESYPGLFQTQVGNKFYVVTQNGVLVPKKPSESLLSIQLELSDGISFLDYKQIFKQQYIEQISTITTLLSDNLLGAEITNGKYYQTERELHVELQNGTLLLFDLDTSAKQQVEKVIVFHKESADILSGDIVYIDLRVKNRIFYCGIDEIRQCEQNLNSIYEA